VSDSWRTKLQTDKRALSTWEAEQGSRPTRRHSHDDPHEDVGIRVHVGVGVVEFQLIAS